MINWLQKLLGLEKSSSAFGSTRHNDAAFSGFHVARMDHAQYIFDSILTEASRGHFNPLLSDFIRHAGLMNQIASSITANRCPTHSRTVSNSLIFVYLEKNDPVGFSWVLESEKKGVQELYLLAVSQKHRKKGIAKALLTETIGQFPKGTKFTARLYHASAVMLRMMIAMGFKRSIKQGSKTIHLNYVSR